MATRNINTVVSPVKGVRDNDPSGGPALRGGGCVSEGVAAGRPRDVRIDEAVLAATTDLVAEVGYAEIGRAHV